MPALPYQIRKKNLALVLLVLVLGLQVFLAYGQQTGLPFYLKDRGTGIPVSMFSTYVNKKEFIVYPFFEYYYDQNAEYKPEELGYKLDQDFRGHFRATEELLFLGYGISDHWAIEMEGAFTRTTLYKSGSDPSPMPGKITEMGLGDVEGQLRYRWLKEGPKRPDIFSYFETVFPLQKKRKIIGTQDWEFALGTGLIRGYTWGTIVLRAAAAYSTGDHKWVPGEYAIEYQKRTSDKFRFSFVLEGEQDEVSIISDLQFTITKNAFIRINNGVGITSKATDYSPEIGILFHF